MCYPKFLNKTMLFVEEIVGPNWAKVIVCVCVCVFSVLLIGIQRRYLSVDLAQIPIHWKPLKQ